MKKIKEVIEISGLSRRTIQYYDDIGLLENRRSSENYRLYDDEDLQRIWEIILYKKMGFHLDEIIRLLSKDENNISIMLERKAVSIGQKISELRKTLDFVEKVIDCGMPNMNVEGSKTYGMTLTEMAMQLFEKS